MIDGPVVSTFEISTHASNRVGDIVEAVAALFDTTNPTVASMQQRLGLCETNARRIETHIQRAVQYIKLFLDAHPGNVVSRMTFMVERAKAVPMTFDASLGARGFSLCTLVHPVDARSMSSDKSPMPARVQCASVDIVDDRSEMAARSIGSALGEHWGALCSDGGSCEAQGSIGQDCSFALRHEGTLLR